MVAEVTTSAETLQRLVGVSPKDLFKARQISQAGAFMAGSANIRGPRGERSHGAVSLPPGKTWQMSPNHTWRPAVQRNYSDNGDYYWSITLPSSVILATFGGGTGLATQRECLELLGCTGVGSAKKLAEIAAATVLAGEISLASAVLAGDWVTGHEQLGPQPLIRRRFLIN